jgi:hypothetical protein
MWIFTILQNNLSFAFQDSLPFRAFIQEVGLTKLPSRSSLTQKYLPALFSLITKQEMKKMNDLPAVSLTSDIWTDCAYSSFLSVTYHYIDETWILQSSVLDIIPLKYHRHFAINLATIIRNRVYQTLGRNTILTTIVTDAASVMKVRTFTFLYFHFI